MRRRELFQMAGVAVISASGAYGLAKRTRFSGDCYVQMGTSITSGVGTKYGASTPDVVGGRLGMYAVNVGFPGSCVGPHKFPELNSLSLCSLADAIATGIWTDQLAHSWEKIRTESLTRLRKLDFSKVDYIGLEYGPNDFHYDRTLDSFTGCLEYAVRRIACQYPKLRIFIITPSWILTEDRLDSDASPNGIGLYLRQYVEAMIQVATRVHIPCLDMWRTSGINSTNYKAFLLDGTHPSDYGAHVRGDVIASFINATF
jgi:lysophospholipase L1-like esterase